MTPRRVALLALAALLVVAAALWLTAHRELPRANLTGTPILPGLLADLEHVQEVRLSGGGNTVTLRREAGGWQVAERSYAADTARIRKLLLDLAQLALLEEKTGTPASYPALGVEDPQAPGARGTLIEIHGTTARRALIVGKPASGGGSYVRLAGEARSALARPQITVEAQASAWLDHELLDIPAERVQQITRGKATGKVLASDDAALKAQFAGLTFEDVRAPGTSPALDVLNLTTNDGLTVRFTGRHEEERRYVTLAVTSSPDAKAEVAAEAAKLAARGSGREFELPAYRYESLFPPAGTGKQTK